MLEKMRVAVVGCGRIAHKHAGLIGNGEVEGLELVAVCDVMEEKQRKYSGMYGVPGFADLDAMLRDKGADIDLVAICTPSGIHAEQVAQVAGYGKHVVVEKPLALTMESADRMIEECDRNGVMLFVVKQNRFNVPVQELRKALEAGRFGRLVLGTVRVRWCREQAYYDQDAWRGTWEMDGGVIANQASHHVDLLQWMMGPVESVFARAATTLVDIEVEDTAIVSVRFANGALGVIEATTATRPTDLEGSISILGEYGTVEVGGFAVNELKTWKFRDELPEDKTVINRASTNPPNVYGFGHKAYYEHVLECIRCGRQGLVDGLEGRRSLELISAIYESIETGEEVRLRFRPTRSRLGARGMIS